MQKMMPAPVVAEQKYWNAQKQWSLLHPEADRHYVNHHFRSPGRNDPVHTLDRYLWAELHRSLPRIILANEIYCLYTYTYCCY